MTLTLVCLVTITGRATEFVFAFILTLGIICLIGMIFRSHTNGGDTSLYSHFLSADTIWADRATRASCFSAVFKCQAEGLSRLPGPPVAAIYLAAEGVAALSIYLPAEVDGKFL